MKVRAKYQFAKNGKVYQGGKDYEVDEKEFETIKSEVDIVEDSTPFRRKKTKEVKSIKTKGESKSK